MREKRLIDADELKKLVMCQFDMQDLYLPSHFFALIDDAPTVDVQVVNHGKWTKSDYPKMLVCSVCRDAYVEDDWLKSNKWQYCPHCGAKMDGKESENG